MRHHETRPAKLQTKLGIFLKLPSTTKNNRLASRIHVSEPHLPPT
jgi:hypothetical protein